jgi:hypothetical protein
MARLSYAGVDLGILLRTLNVHCEADMDPSGTDLLRFRWELETMAVVNPFALATNQPAQGQAGDRVGVTLSTILERLNTPRQRLVFTIGPDRVVDVPGNDSKGNQLPCDPGLGPTTLARITEITGEKTAFLYFKATFHTLNRDIAGSALRNIVLSNRWTVRSQTGADGRSTRLTQGLLIVRPDLAGVVLSPTHADQFRRLAALPCPPNFTRTAGDVQVNETETELRYWFTDSENVLQLGPDGQGCNAVRVRGNVTAGVDSPIRGIKDVASLLKDIGGTFPSSLSDIDFGFLFRPVGVLSKYIPTAKANALVQVTGQPDSDIENLAVLAANVAADRFAPLQIGRSLFVVSAYLTQGLHVDEDVFVELRMEFLPINQNALRALLSPGLVRNMMNLEKEMTSNGLNLRRFGTNPPFQSGNNTRGTYLGSLLAQVLTLPGSLPPAVPPHTVLPDAAGYR